MKIKERKEGRREMPMQMPVSEDMLVPIEERLELKNHASKVEKAAFEVFLEEFKDMQLRKNGKEHLTLYASG